MENNCVENGKERDSSSAQNSSRNHRYAYHGSRRQAGSDAGNRGVGERVRGDDRSRRSATGKRRAEESKHERSQRSEQQENSRYHGRSRRERLDRYEDRENREWHGVGEKRHRDDNRGRRTNSQRSEKDSHTVDKSKEDRKQQRWSNDRRKAWNDDVIRSPLSRLDDYEYPSLSSDDQSSHTPSRLPRKFRKVSEGSSDWATQVEEEEREARAKRDLNQYRRRLELWSGSCSSEDQAQDASKPSSKVPPKMETDPDVLIRRQKQIDYGKNTSAYDNYTTSIKRKQRVKGKHPFTPNKFQATSRRSWDKQVKLWRIKLHDFDPPELLSSKTDKAKKSLIYDDTSSQASSELDIHKQEMEAEAELMNTSITSSISDCYLASNESSRRSTPVTELETMALRASTADSEGVGMEEDENGESTLTGFPETSCQQQQPPPSSMYIKIPTPTVTPAEPSTYPSSPPLNTNDLVAALRRVAVTQEQTVFNYDHISSRPVSVTSNIVVRVNNNNFSGIQTLVSQAQRPAVSCQVQRKRNPNMFDEFNLDECFLKDDEIMAEVV